MAESKHRRRAKPRQPRMIRAGDRTMTFVTTLKEQRGAGADFPSEEEIDAALGDVPEELSWDWAAPRLIPLFERGYGEGVTGDPMINTESPLGIGIGFGIDFGPFFGRVTRSMGERWEASVEQIEHAAFEHLAEVAATVSSRDLQSVVHRGHFFRALGTPAGWASSIVLARESELTRIFRTRDAIFMTPARNSLIAFAPSTPLRAVMEITMQLESKDPNPLELEPFVMRDGVLRWEGLNVEFDDVI